MTPYRHALVLCYRDIQGALMVNDEELLHGMLRCRQLGALPQVHAENGEAVALGQQMVFEAGETSTIGNNSTMQDLYCEIYDL